LNEKLGTGAFGCVYRGHHTDPSKGRHMVAIKVIEIDRALKKGSDVLVRPIIEFLNYVSARFHRKAC
jgi:hypothetical protein